MKKLIEMNAPDVIVAGEAILILRAHLKTESNLSLLGKLTLRLLLESFLVLVLDFKIIWYKIHGLTEDEAIEKACETKK